jgi:hypothetical protein
VFKTKEGAQHPDRDAQFCYIDVLAREFVDAGEPVVSLDCKKKELVGEYANKGREYQPQGSPVRVNGHDFPAGVPKAIPYGVYDIGADDGWVSVGIDHETSAFAVNTLRTWWNAMGKARYPKARRLMLTADGGARTGTEGGHSRWSWPRSPPRPGWTSRSATSHPAPRNGTKLSTRCSRSSPSTGEVGR